MTRVCACICVHSALPSMSLSSSRCRQQPLPSFAAVTADVRRWGCCHSETGHAIQQQTHVRALGVLIEASLSQPGRFLAGRRSRRHDGPAGVSNAQAVPQHPSRAHRGISHRPEQDAQHEQSGLIGRQSGDDRRAGVVGGVGVLVGRSVLTRDLCVWLGGDQGSPSATTTSSPPPDHLSSARPAQRRHTAPPERPSTLRGRSRSLCYCFHQPAAPCSPTIPPRHSEHQLGARALRVR